MARDDASIDLSVMDHIHYSIDVLLVFDAVHVHLDHPDGLEV